MVRALSELADQLIVESHIDKESGARDTGLTTSGEYTGHNPINDIFVRIGKDNVWRLPTQFQAAAGQMVSGIFHDPNTGRSRAGKANLIDAWMAHKWSSRAWTKAGNDIENARGEARLGKEPGKFKC